MGIGPARVISHLKCMNTYFSKHIWFSMGPFPFFELLLKIQKKLLIFTQIKIQITIAASLEVFLGRGTLKTWPVGFPAGLVTAAA